jgi:hypothetical protein
VVEYENCHQESEQHAWWRMASNLSINMFRSTILSMNIRFGHLNVNTFRFEQRSKFLQDKFSPSINAEMHEFASSLFFSPRFKILEGLKRF